ncbi:hypothetical protein CLV35_3938 [Motilibacter peucedani]|uniref:Uncharacterized protein n=1 Tax=Motilibacter peucedani TaxID=598650 RepID=A0A420XJV1_9ACTN|nr:hypothetical protein [Motilibacter peucedani]RKS68031.1 hypothetical protein CLV35_3938 [Motilibacter peucedani]
MPDLPRSVRLAAWGGAVLRATTSPDLALDAVVGDDTRHVVDGLPGSHDDPDGVGVALALGELRRLGVTGLALALPVPGDVAGLPGPPSFNEEALEAGEAVLTRGAAAYALVPSVETARSSLVQVRWRVHAVEPARSTPLPSLAEADRELKEALSEATEELLRLDVARWRPEVLDTLARMRRRIDDASLPDDFAPRAERVLASARTVGAILSLARPDPGAAVSAGAIAMRLDVLDRLSAVTRRALVAAVNSPLEPRPDRG